jgi:hypothetical protein
MKPYTFSSSAKSSSYSPSSMKAASPVSDKKVEKQSFCSSFPPLSAVSKKHITCEPAFPAYSPPRGPQKNLSPPSPAEPSSEMNDGANSFMNSLANDDFEWLRRGDLGLKDHSDKGSYKSKVTSSIDSLSPRSLTKSMVSCC